MNFTLIVKTKYIICVFVAHLLDPGSLLKTINSRRFIRFYCRLVN